MSEKHLDSTIQQTPYLKVSPGVDSFKCVLEYVAPIERRADYVDPYLSLERARGSNTIVSCTFARAKKIIQAMYDAQLLQEGTSISLVSFLRFVRQVSAPKGRDVETYDILQEIISSLSIEIVSESWLLFVTRAASDQIIPPPNEVSVHKPPPRKPTRSSPG